MPVADLKACARRAMKVGAFATAYRLQAEIERREKFAMQPFQRRFLAAHGMPA
jgi:hypothetical protein